MKIKDILQEDISSLKQKVIQQVQSTDDEEMLQRIFTALNKTGLTDRISAVLGKDTDVQAYLKEVVNIIIETPGTYEEKNAFITGYPKGYINVPVMLSGQMVRIEDIITGIPGTPVEFVKRVMYTLAGQTGNVKGPGELALAALSPMIRVSGKGDLKIGNLNIEVKAAKPGGTGSGGRLGEAGGADLAYDQVTNILLKYTGQDYSKSNISVSNFHQVLATIQDQKQRLACANDVFSYIFRNQINVSQMATKAATGQDFLPDYFAANYTMYKQRHGFDSLMMIDFARGYLRNYTDPLVLLGDIGKPSIYMAGPNAVRGNIAQLSFKAFKK
jgi:hypothetical protein